MQLAAKIIILLMSLMGVAELAIRSLYKTSSLEYAEALSKNFFKTIKHSDHKKLPGEEELGHQKMWGYEDDKNDHERRHRFHAAMKQKMMEVKECHRKCGFDHDCHAACPKPWLKFQEKCDKLQPIFDCHEKCHHARGGLDCHAKCPLPQCPKMAAKVEKARQCHSKCRQGDRRCHRDCPKPMMKIRRKCEQLNQVVSCHQTCKHGDFKCHYQCPKMKSVWKFDDSKGRHRGFRGHRGHGHHGHGHHKEGHHSKDEKSDILV